MSASPTMRPTRRRSAWTKASRAQLEPVIDTLASLHEHWPLTLRQLYYQLVAHEVIENNQASYKRLSRLLTRARLDGLVSWQAIEDRSRSTLDSGAWSDSESFVGDQVARFLRGYRRDLLQSQPAALELWVEKDALSRLCHEVAVDYCVPVIVARGFSSVSYVDRCRRRVLGNAEEGRVTRILYFGDLDPSGWEMLPTMLVTLQDEMELGDMVEGHRWALTPEQVDEYELPYSPDALKQTDTRARRYVKRFGNLAVELDALSPATLQALVREAIESNLDMELFESERDAEGQDHVELLTLRDRVTSFLGQEGDFDV